MFFAGRLPRLPWETRARVEALVKQYDRTPLRNTAERFRFGTLQARFTSFCDLWEKSLRAKEEGRTLAGRGRKPVGPPPPPTRSGAEAKNERDEAARDRLVHEACIRDPIAQGDRVKELYQQLAEARDRTGEPQIPFDRFSEVVRAQVQHLGREGHDVSFKVDVIEGKVKLTVKAVE
jgi:hypothetical protein